MKYMDQFGVTGVSAGDRKHFGGAPTSVAVMKDGSILVPDAGGQGDRLIRLSPDLQYIDQFGETSVFGNDRQHLRSPEGVAVAKDGSILVLDINNARLVRLTEDLKYIDQFGQTGVTGSDRNHMGNFGACIAVAKDGSILFTDLDNGRVVRLDEDLKFVDQVTITHPVFGIDDVVGLGVANDGSILVGCAFRIIRLDEDFQYLDQFGDTLVGAADNEHIVNDVYGMAVLPDGSIFAPDSSGHRIIHLTEDLKFIDQFGETGVSGADRQHLNGPADMAYDPDGSILVCDEGNRRIIRLSEN